MGDPPERGDEWRCWWGGSPHGEALESSRTWENHFAPLPFFMSFQHEGIKWGLEHVCFLWLDGYPGPLVLCLCSPRQDPSKSWLLLKPDPCPTGGHMEEGAALGPVRLPVPPAHCWSGPWGPICEALSMGDSA